MIATLLMLCYLPQPVLEDPFACDLIVLNQTSSAGWQYTQLVMIDDGVIINVEWQPTFGTGKPQRWMMKSQVADSYLVTVTNSYGDLETWKAPHFVETKTPNNRWMGQFRRTESQ